MQLKFKDRVDAGRQLAKRLLRYRNSNALVLGVPRGGVVVAHVVASELGLPLDIVLAKKIGHPQQPEYAIGSVSMDEVLIDVRLDIPRSYLDKKVEQIRERLRDQEKLYRAGRAPLDVKGRTLIIVDDGIATGSTLLASVDVLRKGDPAKIIVAVPVAPRDSVAVFKQHVDEFICLSTPDDFYGVGVHYENFTGVEDEEVVDLLRANGNIPLTV